MFDPIFLLFTSGEKAARVYFKLAMEIKRIPSVVNEKFIKLLDNKES